MLRVELPPTIVRTLNRVLLALELDGSTTFVGLGGHLTDRRLDGERRAFAGELHHTTLDLNADAGWQLGHVSCEQAVGGKRLEILARAHGPREIHATGLRNG